jgi:TolA-binding protein
MRYHLLGALALIAAANPALAQRRQPPVVQPEIGETQRDVQSGNPAGTAIADLTARLDALETQNRSLIGQIEESENRIRQLEAALRRLQSSTENRLDAVESAARRPEPEPEPAAAPSRRARVEEPAAEPAPAARRTAGAEPASAARTPPNVTAAADPAEAAYNTGFRMWTDRRYGEAQRTLEAVARDHPNSRWASWARNLAGRAYLDDNKPATAARLLLENYQANPQGDRASDSLFYLGQALVRLDRRTEACRVYDELQSVYGTNMRSVLRDQLPAARTAARCRN